ncbi:Oligoribonuclease, mitochondrial [Portunus trituberculatus]|uniref:Oligoribonuclease, mitochondrial n=1 Tax=Portunus trituberculatus TaxID=210409 RepID=A0A5B7FBB0_PORTR|nr:Oligoribonuclease, mitochondrial [Portunus trituberculatus]
MILVCKSKLKQEVEVAKSRVGFGSEVRSGRGVGGLGERERLAPQPVHSRPYFSWFPVLGLLVEYTENRTVFFVLSCCLTTRSNIGKAPLAGNSVHADKKFLDKYMPKLMKHLHYRIVDVSTVKELCRIVRYIIFNNLLLCPSMM